MTWHTYCKCAAKCANYLAYIVSTWPKLGAHQEHCVNHVARATDRTKVSADVIQLAAHEKDPSLEQAMSEGDASDSDGSESASDSEQNDPPSSLVADAEQYELMQIAYAAVGQDFKDVTGGDDLIGSEYYKLQKLEMVPERWPLARLSFSLQTCVDHLDRVLAGCCWEVQATRTTPPDSLTSLHEVAKCLTMQLAVYLAKEVAGYDFHHLRKKYDVRTMWGDLDPQWRLLQSQLEASGPGWYSPAELKERLFTNKSKRPGDDTKEALRTDDNTIAWQAWHAAHDLIWQSCIPGPPLVFPGEYELISAMYTQIGEEEQVISPPYTRTPLDASMRGRKKRKQGEDNALVGKSMQHGLYAHALVYDTSIVAW
eukprot:symbB.v1.2.035412.t1/scaffold4762.1/size40733/3